MYGSFNYEQFGAMMVLVIPALAAGIALIIKSLKGVKDEVKTATAAATAAQETAVNERTANSDDLKDLVGSLGARLDSRFAAVNRRLDGHGTQLNALTQKMDKHIRETSSEKVS